MITSGSFLLSTPALAGSYWQDKVVFLPEHNENGTWGLILNFSARMPMDEVLKGAGSGERRHFRFFFGGPVQEELVQVLEVGTSRVEGSTELMPGLFLSSVSGTEGQHLVPLLADEKTRIFLGYAGWAPGQLKDELEKGAWELVSPDPLEILSVSRDQPIGTPSEFKRQFVLT